VTSSRGRSLALGDRLAVSLATAKRLPSAKDSPGIPLKLQAGLATRHLFKSSRKSRRTLYEAYAHIDKPATRG